MFRVLSLFLAIVALVLMGAGLREKRDTGHRSSAPLNPGSGSGPGKGFIPSRGGPELAVGDNANLRADGFKPETRPVKNESPAIGKGIGQ